MWLLISAAWAATLNVGPGETYTTISAAVTAATSGDEIQVAAGTYTECVDFGGKNLDLRGAGADATFLVGAGSCAAALTLEADEAATIADLQISYPGARALSLAGGAVDLSSVSLVDSGGSTVSGGAISAVGGTLSVTDCTLSGNSGKYGGAIYLSGGAVATLTDTTLSDNSSVYGGGAAYTAGSGEVLDLLRVTATGNSSDANGGAVQTRDSSTLRSQDGIWEGNSGRYGGAILAGGDATFSGDSFSSNASSYYGGALDLGEASLEDVSFVGNQALDLGGAIYTGGSEDLEIEGGTFQDNMVTPRTTSYATTYGAAIYAKKLGILRLKDLSFSGNGDGEGSSMTGTALYLDGAEQVEVSDLSVEGSADLPGVALYASGVTVGASWSGLDLRNNEIAMVLRYNDEGVLSTISDSIFEDNGSETEGCSALCAETAAVSIRDSRFAGNIGGGDALYGAATVYSWVGDDGGPDTLWDTLELSGCEFEDNGTAGGTGAVPVAGYSLHAVTVTDSVFTGNHGAVAGAISVQADAVTVTRSLFCANTGDQTGAIYTIDSPLILENNLIQENVGGLVGGGLFSTRSTLSATNNTFVGNSAPTGGAIGWDEDWADTTTITNNILAFSSDGYGASAGRADVAAGFVFTYDDWYTNTPGDVGGVLTVDTSAGGNTTADPGFVAYSMDGDCTNDDLRLAEGSALIDAGDPDILDADGTRSDLGFTGGPEGWEPEHGDTGGDSGEPDDTGVTDDTGGAAETGQPTDTDETGEAGDSAESGDSDSPDSPETADSATHDTGGDKAPGCGCAQGSPRSGGAWLLMLGLLARRRRRS